MTRKKLPPLEVDQTYRVQDFEEFEFVAESSWRNLTGEDTAIVRVRLSNATIFEIPAKTQSLKDLMGTLVEAFPSEAIDLLEA